MKGIRGSLPALIALMGLVALPTLCYSAAVMVERNIFSPDRKPPTDEPAPVVAQGNKPGVSAKSIQLDGIIIHGDAKKAIVRVKGQANPIPGDKNRGQSPYVAVKEGGRVAEYQVVKIEPKSITLEKDGQTYLVNLYSEGKILAPLAPIPTAPVAAVPTAEGKQRNIPPSPPGVNNPAATGDNTAANNPGIALPVPQVNQTPPGVPVPEEQAPEEGAVEEEAPPEGGNQ